MKELLKPPKLTKGDNIGIVAPSRHLKDFRVGFDGGVDLLRNMGYGVKLGKYINEEYYTAAGTAEQRAKDFMEMVIDPDIRAIFCAVGGDAANQILPLLDYGLIRQNPKIIMGFSDISHLLVAIWQKSSLVTFHGPDVINLATLPDGASNFLFNLLSGNQTSIHYPKEMKIIRPGKAEGLLVGGNLFVINSLAATSFALDMNGSVLFIEDIDDGLSALDYQLHQMKLAGTFDQINALIVGHIETSVEESRPFEEALIDIIENTSFPIVKVEYFGHKIDNFYAMPLGINASLSTEEGELKLCENPVL